LTTRVARWSQAEPFWGSLSSAVCLVQANTVANFYLHTDYVTSPGLSLLLVSLQLMLIYRSVAACRAAGPYHDAQLVQ